MSKYSIYRKDIPGIFEQVYNQKLDDEDGILEIKLDCLLDSLEPFFRHKRSPFDGRMYFEGTEAVSQKWIIIEDNDLVTNYKQHAIAINSKSTTKTLENLMYTLHDMKGIVFLPIAEMSARKGY